MKHPHQQRLSTGTVCLILAAAAGILLFLSNHLHSPADKPNDPLQVTTPSTEQTFLPAKADEPELLLLVNADHPLSSQYQPRLLTLSNGVQIDQRIYNDLQEMFDTMRAEGMSVKVGEGYRSHEAQEDMMQSYITQGLAQGYTKEQAEEYAASYVAEPGSSEHETGLAVDINADGDTDKQIVYAWLAKHAVEYGFILRYPQGKEQVTGIAYEPWHYRYVGRNNAAAIQESGLTLEEYLQS